MGYHLKIWADRYAFNVEVKGGSMYVRPKIIVITSNYHPKDIWNDNTTLEPILRRFKVIKFVQLITQRETNIEEQEEERVAYNANNNIVPEPILPQERNIPIVSFNDNVEYINEQPMSPPFWGDNYDL